MTESMSFALPLAALAAGADAAALACEALVLGALALLAAAAVRLFRHGSR